MQSSCVICQRWSWGRQSRQEGFPVEVVDAVLARIERLNPTLNAYCTVTAAAARRG